MKRFLVLLFLIATLTQAQVINTYLPIVGDTTDLKKLDYSGICLLQHYAAGTLNGGGFFLRIDSTYVEGKDAFNYPHSGYQWARIQYYEFVEKYISSLDTTTLTTDSTFYTIKKFSSGDIVGVSSTDSTITLGSDAYYNFNANFAYTATDSVSYKIALFKNNVIDNQLSQEFQVADNSTLIQNLGLSGIVKSNGSDVFKIKVEILDNQTNKKFIIREANVKFIKIK